MGAANDANGSAPRRRGRGRDARRCAGVARACRVYLERGPGSQLARRPWSLHASRGRRRGRRRRVLACRVARRRALRRAHPHGPVRRRRANRSAAASRRRPTRSASTRCSGTTARTTRRTCSRRTRARRRDTGVGQTVAVVDAYDAPNVESDLAHYRSRLRAAGLHDRERVLLEGRPERRDQLPGGELELGAGDVARRADGERDLPELSHPAGRGRLRGHRGSRRRGEPARSPSAPMS